jgi:hypothetical protein
LHGLRTDNRRNAEGHGIMVAVCFGRVVRVSHVEEALEHTLGVGKQTLVDAIRSCKVMRI